MFSYRTVYYLGKTVAPGRLSGKNTMMLTVLPEAGKYRAILFSVGSVGRNGKRKEPSTRTLTPWMPLVITECKTFPSLAVACYDCRTSANTRSPTIGRFCGMIDEISVSCLILSQAMSAHGLLVKSYTFWAVLFFGGGTLLITLIQLIVETVLSSIQLKAALEQNRLQMLSIAG